MTLRVGIGADTHRLVAGRKLILGGVEIPFKKGLLGHSDADVLVHAIMDAMLGAMGEGDIGYYFPNLDEQYKDASSLTMLSEVGAMMARQRYELLNLDSVLMAEKPKIFPYRQQMTTNIAEAIGVSPEQVHVKATTTEGLGAIGRGEGVTAYAVVMLQRD
jgi:2-C-methyl-D-erythritol 2,4-cyclodiphosphate synthase